MPSLTQTLADRADAIAGLHLADTFSPATIGLPATPTEYFDELRETAETVVTGAEPHIVTASSAQTAIENFFPSIPYEDIAAWGDAGAWVLIIATILVLLATFAFRAWRWTEKIKEGISTLLWMALFIAASFAIASFAPNEFMRNVSAAYYISATACCFGGGVICLAGRIARIAKACAKARLEKAISESSETSYNRSENKSANDVSNNANNYHVQMQNEGHVNDNDDAKRANLIEKLKVIWGTGVEKIESTIEKTRNAAAPVAIPESVIDDDTSAFPARIVDDDLSDVVVVSDIDDLEAIVAPEIVEINEDDIDDDEDELSNKVENDEIDDVNGDNAASCVDISVYAVEDSDDDFADDDLQDAFEDEQINANDETSNTEDEIDDAENTTDDVEQDGNENDDNLQGSVEAEEVAAVVDEVNADDDAENMDDDAEKTEHTEDDDDFDESDEEEDDDNADETNENEDENDKQENDTNVSKDDEDIEDKAIAEDELAQAVANSKDEMEFKNAVEEKLKDKIESALSGINAALNEANKGDESEDKKGASEENTGNSDGDDTKNSEDENENRKDENENEANEDENITDNDASDGIYLDDTEESEEQSSERKDELIDNSKDDHEDNEENDDTADVNDDEIDDDDDSDEDEQHNDKDKEDTTDGAPDDKENESDDSVVPVLKTFMFFTRNKQKHENKSDSKDNQKRTKKHGRRKGFSESIVGNVTCKISTILGRILIAASAIMASALAATFFLEAPSNLDGLMSIHDPFMFYEFLFILGVSVGVWFVFQRKGAALLVTPAIALLYGCAEYYVEEFKASAILPADLQSAGTGLAVAGGYTYDVTSIMLLCFSVFALGAAAASFFRDPFADILSFKKKTKKQNEKTEIITTPSTAGAVRRKAQDARRARKKNAFRFVSFAVKNIVVFIASIVIGATIITATATTQYDIDWERQGVELNLYSTPVSYHQYGIIPSMMNVMQMQEAKTPRGYTRAQADALQDKMANVYDRFAGRTSARRAAERQYKMTKPNVVVIMNETFADLSYLDGLGAGYDGPQWFKNSNAYAKGKLSVSTYGGGTCNTEFELMSGVALSHVGAGINPYVMYDLDNVDSIAKYFNGQGYDVSAIHPEDRNNWQRSKIYPSIGFDTFYDQDDFAENVERHRGHIADSATYDMIMNILRDNDEPQFIWDLTMANHGGWDTGAFTQEELTNYPFYNVIDAYGSAYANEYTTAIRMSDEEVEKFMNEIYAFEEPTVVVFFGDHHPGFSEWFTNVMYGEADTIDKQELLYQTDYAIWANYDIAGWDGITYTQPMNAGELMGYVKNLIGAPLSDYEKAQYASRWWCLTDNAFGYMSEDGVWHDVEETNVVKDVYAQGMLVLDRCLETGVLPSMETNPEQKLNQDKVIFKVMDWITYMNFQSIVARNN